ncbi:MAG: YjjG family noncanonical pyrimidine nucleotidase [Oscillospiraceae bacterium]|nr:YjjG family noncanonical pyrimidine nucleotidase [Oscillospiraceae bacterium]
MIKAVFMDIDDTILDFDKCSSWSIYMAANRMRVYLPENTQSIFNSVTDKLWKEMEAGRLTYDEIFEIRWKVVFSVLGVECDHLEFEKQFLRFLSVSADEVNGARDLLRYLSGKYEIYSATNGTSKIQHTRLELSDMDQYFRGMFISEELGFSKPSREFYDACFERLGNRFLPEEVMAVGNSPDTDIAGAREYGIKTCLFDKKKKYPDCDADYIISRLSEL